MFSSSEPDSDPDNRSGTAPTGPSKGYAATLIRRQRRVQADWAELQRFLDLLQSRLAHSEYSVCVVSDRGIRRYNRRFRSRDEATDVLSFPAGSGRKGTGNYLGDIVMAWTWAVTCGFGSIVPYVYPVFLTSLLLHRERRDERACRAKYGADWDEYCRRVRYRVIPYVY